MEQPANIGHGHGHGNMNNPAPITHQQPNASLEKDSSAEIKEAVPEHDEHTVAGNLTYDDDEHEPEIHLRTWIALLALCLQSFCQLWSLLGPPAVVSKDPVLSCGASSPLRAT